MACWQTIGMPKQPRPTPASAVKEAFALRLQALRHSYGIEIGRPDLTIAAFAEILGLHAETYRTYEKGLREPPLFVLSKIRHVTGVNLNGLVAGDIDRAA